MCCEDLIVLNKKSRAYAFQGTAFWASGIVRSGGNRKAIDARGKDREDTVLSSSVRACPKAMGGPYWTGFQAAWFDFQ